MPIRISDLALCELVKREELHRDTAPTSAEVPAAETETEAGGGSSGGTSASEATAATSTTPTAPSAEFLARATAASVPPHTLDLKVGALVMCVRNMYPKLGILNGTRLRVDSIGANILVCTVAGGEVSARHTVFLPRIPFLFRVPGSTIKIVRGQFPVRLAYAATINKSQGQSISGRLGI